MSGLLCWQDAAKATRFCHQRSRTRTTKLSSGVDSSKLGGYLGWGCYDFEIARDGSSWSVVPSRSAQDMPWGYHMNVVKLLEVSPGKDGITLHNIHVLPNGDVSVDMSIKHPYYDRRYTGFDVMGIIIFPASQIIPDENLRAQVGLGPSTDHFRMANSKFGDAELMNPDGWTDAWNTVKNPEEGEHNPMNGHWAEHVQSHSIIRFSIIIQASLHRAII